MPWSTGPWPSSSCHPHLILPAIALGTIPLAIIARITAPASSRSLRARLLPDARPGPDERTCPRAHRGLSERDAALTKIIGLPLGILFGGVSCERLQLCRSGVDLRCDSSLVLPTVQDSWLVIAIIYLAINLSWTCPTVSSSTGSA